MRLEVYEPLLSLFELKDVDKASHGKYGTDIIRDTLDKNIKVAKIAKVREKVSNGEEEFENVDDALEDIPEEERLGRIIEDDDDEEDGKGIFPTEEEE